MFKVFVMVVSVLVASSMMAMANCGSCGKDKAAADGKKAMKCKEMSLYACAKCATVAKEAGKCSKCEGEMAKMRVLECKDGAAKLCPCDAGCKCTIDAKDATKCGCGKALVSVSVKELKGCKGCKAPADKPADKPVVK
jgi:hypothetical protein